VGFSAALSGNQDERAWLGTAQTFTFSLKTVYWDIHIQMHQATANGSYKLYAECNVDIARNRTVPLMRSMHQVLSKQERLQVVSEGGTVEIRVSQFIRQ